MRRSIIYKFKDICGNNGAAFPVGLPRPDKLELAMTILVWQIKKQQ